LNRLSLKTLQLEFAMKIKKLSLN